MIPATPLQKTGPRISHRTLSSQDSPTCPEWIPRYERISCRIEAAWDILSCTIRLSESYCIFFFITPPVKFDWIFEHRKVQSNAERCFVVAASSYTCEFPKTSYRHLPDFYCGNVPPWIRIMVSIVKEVSVLRYSSHTCCGFSENEEWDGHQRLCTIECHESM